MEREIKFRAWDKEKKMFLYFALHPQKFNWGETDYTKTSDMNGYLCGINFPNISDWMQFTGLKDKNGKDIYEGDIIKISNHDEVYFGIIKFNHQTGRFMFFDIADQTLYGLMSNDQSNEVVGNIYENPELLK